MNPRSRFVCIGEMAVRDAAGKQRAIRPRRTHLSTPRVHGFAPTRKTRRQRLSGHVCCPFLLCPSYCAPDAVRTAIHPASDGDMRLFASERAEESMWDASRSFVERRGNQNN